MTNFWRDRRVLITGGNGFLGSHVVEQAVARGATVSAPRSAECNLLHPGSAEKAIQKFRPNLIIHLAATVGGIGANRENPGRFFYENAMMGISLIEAARLHGVEKTVVLGTVCAYPKHTAVPFREEDIWNGYPEETNAPYGIAKKALLVQLQAYREQYGMNGVFLVPVNLYGPGDNFDPKSSHVIPALIRRLVEAKDKNAASVEIWGSGQASREFLYVEDCARAIIMACEHYNGAEPVNVGTGEEITIGSLARLIASLCGFAGELVFDPTKPDGQPRRKLDTTRAQKEFGFEAKVRFEEGLPRTIKWYMDRVAAERSVVSLNSLPNADHQSLSQVS